MEHPANLLVECLGIFHCGAWNHRVEQEYRVRTVGINIRDVVVSEIPFGYGVLRRDGADELDNLLRGVSGGSPPGEGIAEPHAIAAE